MKKENDILKVPGKTEGNREDSPASGRWINPIGGLGDTLMVSGVLKLLYDRDPSTRYNLARRSRYASILEGHPAIGQVGHPPKDAEIVSTDYWSKEDLGGGSQRAFQVLARSFGLPTPIEEKLYLPIEPKEDPILDKFIPWKEKNVLISPSSESPRKMMHPLAWHRITEQLNAKGVNVMQSGRVNELRIKGAYSLLGITTPRQLVAVIRKCQLVITSDNFVMHAAHLAGVPAVVVWGPTDHRTYGYAEQLHFQASTEHCSLRNECIGVGFAQNYPTACPLGPDHCINRIPVEEVIFAAFQKL
jgi:ADP-heptose:LPS heptosyltransferase